ncbi:MAG: hypothetical protein IAF02_18255 [Anaerolineae bacterium]|nr:hypothetical protein [Anaerolineae bacterium]
MDENIRQLVQAIHDSPTHIVLVTAGAGTQALSHLLGVAGASRTLLEALIPYNQASFDDFLGQSPSQYVADETACLMAGRAYTRARWLLAADSPVLGIACTATIATDRPKRGEHRAHIALWQPEQLICHRLLLEKGTRDRAGEEDVISRQIINMLADACGLAASLPLSLAAADSLTEIRYEFGKPVQALLRGELSYFSIEDNGRLHTTNHLPQLLLSGSFNPLHAGHLEMAQTAAALTHKPVAFELPIANADKPPLPQQTVLRRLAQFAGRHAIYVSTAPTFVEKSRLYPGTTFVVGYDTALRILQPRFYQNSQAIMLESLAKIKAQGCSFLVAGRVAENGRFHQASDLTILQGFTDLFQPIPFRKDISSSELRKTGQKGSR